MVSSIGLANQTCGCKNGYLIMDAHSTLQQELETLDIAALCCKVQDTPAMDIIAAGGVNRTRCQGKLHTAHGQ